MSPRPKPGCRSGCVKTDTNNFNPRVGVAYRPFDDGRTVFRGGYGIYTVPLYGSISYSMYASATGDVPSFQNAALPGGGFAIQFPNVFPAALRGIPGAGTQDFRRANQIDLRDPQTHQWTATVERDLGWKTGLRVSYIGSYTRGLVYSPDLNQVQSNSAGYAAVRDQRPFRDWNVVTTRDNGSKVTLRRARHGGDEALQRQPQLQLLLYPGVPRLRLRRRGADRLHRRERSLGARSLPR